MRNGHSRPKVKIKHRAKQEIKRTLKPSSARGLWGLGAKPLAEYEAEPHSAQADKVQIVMKNSI